MRTVMMWKFTASMINPNKSLNLKRNHPPCSGAVAAVSDNAASLGALTPATLGLIGARNVEISSGRRILASVEAMKNHNGTRCELLVNAKRSNSINIFYFQ